MRCKIIPISALQHPLHIWQSHGSRRFALACAYQLFAKRSSSSQSRYQGNAASRYRVAKRVASWSQSIVRSLLIEWWRAFCVATGSSGTSGDHRSTRRANGHAFRKRKGCFWLKQGQSLRTSGKLPFGNPHGGEQVERRLAHAFKQIGLLLTRTLRYGTRAAMCRKPNALSITSMQTRSLAPRQLSPLLGLLTSLRKTSPSESSAIPRTLLVASCSVL